MKERSRYTGLGASGKGDDGQKITRIPIFLPGRWIRLKSGETVRVEAQNFYITDAEKPGVWRVVFCGGRSALVTDVERLATEAEIREAQKSPRQERRKQERAASAPGEKTSAAIPRARASQHVSPDEQAATPEGWQEALRVAERMALGMTRTMPPECDRDDAISLAYQAVCEALRNFSPGPDRTFPLFASRMVKWRLIDWQREEWKRLRGVSERQPEAADERAGPERETEAREIVAACADALLGVDREMLYARLREDTEQELIRLTGGTRSTMQARWRRIRKRLKALYPDL